MTTRSSQDRKKTISEIGELSLKFTKAIDLINQGKRSPDDVAILSRALQLFREGDLLGLVTKSYGELKTAKFNLTSDMRDQEVLTVLQERLSIKVDDSSLPKALKQKLHLWGIYYLGEILMLKHFIHGKTRDGKIVREFFSSFVGLALSRETDINPTDIWVPPYWKDENVIRTLNLPLDQVVEVTGSVRWLIRDREWRNERIAGDFKNRGTVGDFLRSRETFCAPFQNGSWSTENLLKIRLHLKKDCGVHAGMLLK